MGNFDSDAMIAAVHLVGRSGAAGFELGYHPAFDEHGNELDEATTPASRFQWWAKAQYRGAMLAVDDHPGPVEAAEALARRILRGALCAHCRQPVTLDDTAGCRWTRNGNRWIRACEKQHPRAERRRAARTARRSRR